MASTVQSRLQFFSSLSGSQSSLNNRTPPYNSRSSLHASQRSLSRSLDTLPAQAVEQDDSGKFMPVRDRIARYGVTPNKQQGPLADIKGRFKGASMEELPGPAESAGKTRLTASRAHPYPTSGNASSRHASEVDLRKDDVVEKQEKQSEVQREQEQTNDESVPVNLANRLAAYQAAATSPAAANPVANNPVKPEVQSKQQQAPSFNTSASKSSPPQQAKFGVNNKCAACSKTVYLMEQTIIDNAVFHKTCLKCAHCKSTLKMGNLASMNGQYYCKPHFKQLFKLKGNYAEGFGLEDHKKQWLTAEGKSS